MNDPPRVSVIVPTLDEEILIESCLEQLRALWYGDRIYVCDALERSGIGVDTLEDLEKIRRIIKS